MPPINNYIRSAAAARRMNDRSRQRKLKEKMRNYRLHVKQRAAISAADAVDKYEEYVYELKSVHKNVSDTVDWMALLDESAPEDPVISHQYERLAREKLVNFKPTFFDKIFGTTAKKISKLTQKLELAKEKDQTDFDTHMRQHHESVAEQETLKSISKGVLDNDIHSYKAAIDYFKPFSEINELGWKFDFTLNAHNATFNLDLNSKTVIPGYILSLTSTGKLSQKSLPITKFNELYQDYVCSCILKVARETYAHLPINLVVVNVTAKIYNSSTGMARKEVIVSVTISPDILNELNFNLIDPSDAMKNFICNMKFGKTTGFAGVQKIEADNLIK